MTLKERYLRYLTQGLGGHTVPTRTKKYIAVFIPANEPMYYFLGSHGAIRFNIKNSVVGSFASTFIKRRMEIWERERRYTDE